MFIFSKKIFIVSIAILVAAGFYWVGTREAPVDFSADVKPIFNKKCISCHGGVKKQGNFSVLFRTEALAKTKSGKWAIVPGDPEHSELIRRIRSRDPEDRMPYHHDPLSDQEISVLTKWIRQGARWGDHWAFTFLKPVEVPRLPGSFFGLIPGKGADWARNPVDNFIYQKIAQQHLTPSPEADKPTLLRRVSLDLTGLPPSASLASKFLTGNQPQAYEELVDSLLASPHYGEKWAAGWLDIARYADTKGYERDAGRSIWRYRDWLIKAFNADKPYDKFITEQIAGDLLPGATDDQFIATAFHRNTMTNDEGGTDNEEFRTAAVMDRVNTTWQGILGTTFACVQCHSHPYDPFTHDEYYKFMAFFNDSRDEDTWADYPLLRQYNSEDSSKLASLVSWLRQQGYQAEAKNIYQFLKTWQPAFNSLRTNSFVNCELNDTKWLAMRNPSTARLQGVLLDGKTQLIYRYSTFAPGGTWTIHLDKPDGPVLKSIRLDTAQHRSWIIGGEDLPTTTGVHDLYISYANPALKDPNQNGLQFDWFYFTEPFPGKGKAGYDSAYLDYWNLLVKEVPSTPVMMDNPSDMHRATYVFERGNWLVKGKQVSAATPHTLNPLPAGAPANRLGLAMWLTSEANPLTARTMVNRLWEQLFGTGLVETLEDLGTQGAEPTHRELLDYLSYRFMHEDGWSVKKLLKEMVMSATYRQDSKLSKESGGQDPFNKYYSRSSRVRLSAEQIRDQALAVSGLLSEKVGGPSVMPWQPEGIWMSPWNGEYWISSKGEDQYRRALYTFWKRTAPYPSMISFDGVGREVCTARRIRTNTPLQALVTLNDSVYLDAARHFAWRMQQEKGDVQAQISRGYEIAMQKKISSSKLLALTALYKTALNKFSHDKQKTFEMAGLDKQHNQPPLAALVVVANAILNLDEFITKS
ncbi:MAG: DUF1553 domain-containing protein [Williamsia sp.]|nr:DUF1553 domain-containing protein [Williamsia sp.]